MDCPDLTLLQKGVGLITMMNTFAFFAMVLGTGAFGYIAWRWLSFLFGWIKYIPVQIYEGLGYVTSVALMAGAYFVSPLNQIWMIFPGCLLLAISLAATATIHRLKSNPFKFSMILTLVWGAAALVYQSTPVGFITMMALFSALGFSFFTSPLCYSIGFREGKDKGTLGQATVSALILLGGFVALRIMPHLPGITAPWLPYVQVFELGALWTGAFVGYLGLLIGASKYYDQSEYGLMQLVNVVFGVGALFFGTYFQIPELSGIGGTFFCFFLLEKMSEIPVQTRLGWAYLTLIICGIVGTAFWWSRNHMDLVGPYLLF